jgi:beta-glucosidase
MIAAVTETADLLPLMCGFNGPYVGNVDAHVLNGGKPFAVSLQDGPQGLGDGTPNITGFPSTLSLGATFDTDLAEEYGRALSAESEGKGVMILLGPMLNLMRMPLSGRMYESLGEDVTLTSDVGGAYVRGVQASGRTIATIKHYAGNNQEYNRTTVSDEVSATALAELYLRPFTRIVARENPGAAMCSYNRVNGTYACEQPDTIGYLRRYGGFNGFMMSDWGATHSTVPSINAGLDAEMPGSVYFNPSAIAGALATGKIQDGQVRAAAAHLAYALLGTSLLQTPLTGSLSASVRTPAHVATARRIAAAGTVLLRNEGNVLPIDATSTTTLVAIVGDTCTVQPVSYGQGSGRVNGLPGISLADAVAARFPSLQVITAPTHPYDAAEAAAAKADIVIICVSDDTSGEGRDRTTTELPALQSTFISQVLSSAAAAKTSTVVVAHNDGPFATSGWLNATNALVAAHLPGETNGDALADVLFNASTPLGHSPYTWPSSDAQLPFDDPPRSYPGVNNQVFFTEGLNIGYRWYDARGIRPAFPFGHGLQYTTFTYADLDVTYEESSDSIVVVMSVTNSGSNAGSAAPQVYVSFGSRARHLAAFARQPLASGASEVVTLTIDAAEAIATFASPSTLAKGAWSRFYGTVDVVVGESLTDLRLSGSVVVPSSL